MYDDTVSHLQLKCGLHACTIWMVGSSHCIMQCFFQSIYQGGQNDDNRNEGGQTYLVHQCSF